MVTVMVVSATIGSVNGSAPVALHPEPKAHRVAQPASPVAAIAACANSARHSRASVVTTKKATIFIRGADRPFITLKDKPTGVGGATDWFIGALP